MTKQYYEYEINLIEILNHEYYLSKFCMFVSKYEYFAPKEL